MKKANEAIPENADRSYAVRLFHPYEQPDFDVGAVAQTAETYFVRLQQQWFIAQTAQLIMNCLQCAINEEGRKIEFPVVDYDAIPDPAEEKLERFGREPRRVNSVALLTRQFPYHGDKLSRLAAPSELTPASLALWNQEFSGMQAHGAHIAETI